MGRGVDVEGPGAASRRYPAEWFGHPADQVIGAGDYEVVYQGPGGVPGTYLFAVRSRKSGDSTAAGLILTAGETTPLPWVRDGGPLVLTVLRGGDGGTVTALVSRSSPSLQAIIDRASGGPGVPDAAAEAPAGDQPGDTRGRRGRRPRGGGCESGGCGADPIERAKAVLAAMDPRFRKLLRIGVAAVVGAAAADPPTAARYALALGLCPPDCCDPAASIAAMAAELLKVIPRTDN